MAGASYGTPGGSLTHDTGWAKNKAVASIGHAGEQAVGVILNSLILPSDRAVVCHDLNVPIPRFNANIDHVVVAGDHVLPIDSKTWAPGFYFTLGGKSYRGLKRAEHTEKKTMSLIGSSLTSYLPTATVETPLVAVNPTRGSANVKFLKMEGAKVVTVRGMKSIVQSFIRTHGPADPEITTRLRRLLNDQNS